MAEHSDSGPPELSLAQSLPQELLSEIFLECLHCPEDDIHLQPDITIPPLLLCLICSSWRQTALATPRLWTDLVLQLEYVSVRSHLGGGLLRQKLRVLDLWSSRMGALAPSIHLQRSHLRVHVSNDKAEVERRFTTFQEFFTSPPIAAANLLCLHAFSAPDLLWLSKIISQLSFPNLSHLIISQPSGREHNTSTAGSTTYFSSLSAPNLKRLYLDSHTELASRPSTIIEAFSWSTLTHLAANLKLRRLDWYTILDRCTSLTHCAVKLEFFHPWATPDSNDRKTSYHQKLTEASVQTVSFDVHLIFEKFDLPSLRKLRISLSDASVPLPQIHKLLASTPGVRELHLQGCIGFGNPSFAEHMERGFNQGISVPEAPGESLSTLLPDLQTLVIDSIGYRISSTALPRDLLILLRSQWLCAGWSLEQVHTPDITEHGCRSIDFILDKGPHFSSSIVRDLMRILEEDREKLYSSCPFEVKARYLQRGLWEWRQMGGSHLRDGWATCAKWMH
ncbi:hypothetical protein CPB83DRAFT_864776 [Crepidotus variabilis]|uniref:F-box domain-containing protein n=1 Tax=Crepidotus variabilis TaxID=179855 RepID=A0A9P6JIC2_9AGAR|nr:hypothetical protein CPB83DRAFT_864776 [Crepidotus variabilis]